MPSYNEQQNLALFREVENFKREVESFRAQSIRPTVVEINLGEYKQHIQSSFSLLKRLLESRDSIGKLKKDIGQKRSNALIEQNHKQLTEVRDGLAWVISVGKERGTFDRAFAKLGLLEGDLKTVIGTFEDLLSHGDSIERYANEQLAHLLDRPVTPLSFEEESSQFVRLSLTPEDKLEGLRLDVQYFRNRIDEYIRTATAGHGVKVQESEYEKIIRDGLVLVQGMIGLSRDINDKGQNFLATIQRFGKRKLNDEIRTLLDEHRSGLTRLVSLGFSNVYDRALDDFGEEVRDAAGASVWHVDRSELLSQVQSKQIPQLLVTPSLNNVEASSSHGLAQQRLHSHRSVPDIRIAASPEEQMPGRRHQRRRSGPEALESTVMESGREAEANLMQRRQYLEVPGHASHRRMRSA